MDATLPPPPFFVGTHADSAEDPAQRGIHWITGPESRHVFPAKNPGFLALSHDKKTLYSVNGVSEFQSVSGGGVTAMTLNSASGLYEFTDALPVEGKSPCHLALDTSSRILVTANYSSASITVFSVSETGTLAKLVETMVHEGSGPHAERQKEPHPHGVTFSPDSRFVIIPDLGTDELVVYRVDAATPKLELDRERTTRLAPGSGPRHAVFSPDGRFLYVINELSNTVTVLSWQNDTLKELQTIPTLPESFQGFSKSAEIVVHPNGRYVYASNRGHDSIAIFSRDPESGVLEVLGHEILPGPEPRGFDVDPSGEWLVVGNQKINTVTAFRLTEEGRDLQKTGFEWEVPSPVCILFPR